MIGKEDDGASQVALVVKNCLPMQETLEMWARSLGGKIPWRRTCNPLQYSCLENPRDRGPGRLQSIGSQKVGQD